MKYNRVSRTFVPSVEIGIVSYCRSTVLLWRRFFFKYPLLNEIILSFFVLVCWVDIVRSYTNIVMLAYQ